MVYLTYMLSELRRRKGRTLLTALGLALGIALVDHRQRLVRRPRQRAGERAEATHRRRDRLVGHAAVRAHVLEHLELERRAAPAGPLQWHFSVVGSGA